jgi:KDO2-lipid IV(A) lauroyltransferase
MKIIRYFFQFIIIIFLFLILKTLGYKLASNLGCFIGSQLGPFFRSKRLIQKNIKNSLTKINDNELKKIIKGMWENYGKILTDYMYMKKFRYSKLQDHIEIEGKEIFEEIKKNNKPVIFVSGHFSNFELMAMEIEKSGVNVAALYRPLNNIFLNKIMEFIRKKYICKNQIKKGFSGLREMVSFFKKNVSIALMIDQRVSEGIQSNFFKRPALTTTIPAQFVKKFNCDIVPIYIKRIGKFNYKMTINKPIGFRQNQTIEVITEYLNRWLE